MKHLDGVQKARAIKFVKTFGLINPLLLPLFYPWSRETDPNTAAKHRKVGMCWKVSDASFETFAHAKRTQTQLWRLSYPWR